MNDTGKEKGKVCSRIKRGCQGIVLVVIVIFALAALDVYLRRM